MSTYYRAYEQLQATQNQAVVILAVIGFVWAVSWLLIDRVLPARWREWAQWVYLLLAMVLGGFTIYTIGGGI